MSMILPQPIPLLTRQQILHVEESALSSVSAHELMDWAGKAAFDHLLKTWPAVKKIVVACGAGNNGGDGYVVARLAHLSGKQVTIWHPLGTSQSDPAKAAALECTKLNILMTANNTDINWSSIDVVVDGLMGIGYQGTPLKAEIKGAIDTINWAQKPVLSLDCPSGLNVDTGCVDDCAVSATETVTFLARKRGLFTGDALDYCGKVTVKDLSISADPALLCSLYDIHSILQVFTPRRRTSYKGTYGHVLIIGGNSGYAGAARLAGLGALRCGAGLVSLATHPDHCAGVAGAVPELMVHGIKSPESIVPLIDRASTLVIGPGLGQDHWAQVLMDKVLDSSKPLIIDADALNLLAKMNRPQRQNWILTPHPGEAARLCSTPVESIQRDRFKAVEDLTERYGGVVVLKGPGTLIKTQNGSITLCPYGNPGMASGGMGDLLSGVIAGLVAQGYGIEESAVMGTYIHAYAADLAAQEGERGMIATDLLSPLRKLVNGILN